jgi:hypothetical protein
MFQFFRLSFQFRNERLNKFYLEMLSECSEDSTPLQSGFWRAVGETEPAHAGDEGTASL